MINPTSIYNNSYHQQYQIPNFNPSLSQSRKSNYSIKSQKYNTQYKTNTQNIQYNFNKKNKQQENTSNISQRYYSKQYPQQFWQQIYNQQIKVYKNTINKYNMLEQSINLHKQTLSLRNQQNIDNQQRIQQIIQRIKLTNEQSKYNDNKIKNIAQKCLQVKNIIGETMRKIQSQQKIIVQQDKHIEDIEKRIRKMKQDIEGLQQQIQQLVNKQRICQNIMDQNQRLEEYLEKLENQETYTKVKIGKDKQQDQNIVHKMKQLQKVIAIREKNIRQLGKKLIQMKKLNPQFQRKQKNIQKQMKLPQIIKNIRQMQYQYGKIQQQIYKTGEKIENITTKTQEKIKSIQIIKLKYKKSMADYQQNQQQNIQKVSFQQKNNRSNRSQNNSPAQYPTTQSYELKNNRQLNLPNFQSQNITKKPIGYRVIQSEQNEQILYPRTTQTNMSNQNQHNYTHSFQNSHSNPASYSERQHTQQNQPYTERDNGKGQKRQKTLHMTQSIKNLLTRYQNIKNNSKFKH